MALKLFFFGGFVLLVYILLGSDLGPPGSNEMLIGMGDCISEKSEQPVMPTPLVTGVLSPTPDIPSKSSET